MSLKESFIEFLTPPTMGTTSHPRRDEMRPFINGPDALSTPLAEFEMLFDITEVSDDNHSSFYRPEDPHQIAVNKKTVDEFLNE